MKTKRALLCLVGSAIGCSSGTEVNGNVNGNELAASEAVWVEEGDETTPVRRVVIADRERLCDLLRSGESPEGMTSLEIRLVGLGGDDEDYEIAAPGETEAPHAQASFEKAGDLESSAQASGGSVTTDGSEEDVVEAEFDLDFGDAGALDGSFVAERCDLEAAE